MDVIWSLVLQGPQMPEGGICLALVFWLAAVKTHSSSSLSKPSLIFLEASRPSMKKESLSCEAL